MTIEIGTDEKDAKDAYLYRLRKNSILTWVDKLSDVSRYRDILQQCNLFSTLTLENGIVRIDPAGRYIGHRFAPYLKAGMSFNEVATILKAEIILFEEEYGKVSISDKDLNDLTNIAYKYNRLIGKLDMANKKQLIHLEQTATVLYYLTTPSVELTAQVNGWCTLTFTKNNNSTKDYCTIYTEEEMLLLQKINKAISK